MQEQLDQEDCGSEEGGSEEDGLTEGGDWCADELDGEIGEMPAEVGVALVVDGGKRECQREWID